MEVQAQELQAAKDLRLVQRRLEPPSDDEVQISMRATTLCGSDLHYFTYYRNGDIQIREPLTPGHECAGVVAAVGQSAARDYGLAVGDRVVVEVGVPCGDCDQCSDGTYNVCGKLRFRSSATAFPHYQGTLQERFNHPARWVHKLPASISYAQGALLEPLCVAIHAARKANASRGSTCLVIGAGAVGLLCAAVAKSSGYRRVVMTDIAMNRLEFGLSNGFADAIIQLSGRRSSSIDEALEFAKEDAAALQKENNNEAFHRTFECTGVESCLRTSIYVSSTVVQMGLDARSADIMNQATRNGGKVLLVGMGTPVQTLPVSAAALREVDLVGVWRYADCYPESIRLMEAAGQGKGPDIRKLVTHSFDGLGSALEAFAMAARTCDDNGALVIKVVIENRDS